MTDTAKGFGYSIYFLLLLVFGVIFTIVFFVARMIIREEKAQALKEQGSTPTPP